MAAYQSIPFLWPKEFARFCKFFVQGDGCWEWTGARVTNGYGQFGAREKQWMAHRLAYRRFIGPIPDGLVIDHLCRNRACVNPAHMEAVTLRENIRRGRAGLRWKKGFIREPWKYLGPNDGQAV